MGVAHPGVLLIFGLPGGQDLIDNAIDAINSINDEHERFRRDLESHGPEHFEIWDPVLVVIDFRTTFWVGASKPKRKILEALIAEGGFLAAEKVSKLLPDRHERTQALLGLRNDTSILTIHDDYSLELGFSLSNIIASYTQELLEPLKFLYQGWGAIYRTPSLQLVRKWPTIEEILKTSSCPAELAISALSIAITQHEAWTLSGPATFVLSDFTTREGHIGLLQRCLGVALKETETLLGEAGIFVLSGRHLIDSKSRVVIFFDIMISDEPAERCVQQVLRDHATPIAVSCLFDARENAAKGIEIWGINVPVIALSKLNIVVDSAAGGNIANINPITKREEVDELPEDKNLYPIKKEVLLDLIETHTALRFSHIGRPIGRHFTFYLGSPGLIEDPLIYKAFDDEINNWKKTANDPTMRIEIWHPESEPQPSAPAKTFAAKIYDRRKEQEKDIVSVRAISREAAHGRWFFPEGQRVNLKSPNVLVIDWGALTGSTVMQMIRFAAETGAERIMVCIFLSQLPLTEESFLTLINSLRISRSETQTNGEPQLNLKLKKEDVGRLNGRSLPVTIPVSVRFLGRFPIEAYESENNCPVCEGLAKLTRDFLPSELLSKFPDWASRRWLRLRSREEVQRNDSESFLSHHAAIQMSEFRADLVSALSSTRVRQRVSEWIETLHSRIKCNPTLPPEEAISFITFLSIETQWLHRSPLYLRKLREMIANISLAIARNSKLDTNHRLKATLLLRISSKKLFVANFPEVFGSAIGIRELQELLLYSVFTYTIRPYHQSVKMFQPLLDNLYAIGRNYRDRNLVDGDVAETIDILIHRTKQLCINAGVRFDTPAESWRHLQTIFHEVRYQKHEGIPDAINEMHAGQYYNKPIEEAIQQYSENKSGQIEIDSGVLSWLRKRTDLWEKCCGFIDEHVLPHLAHLKPILESDLGRQMIGSTDVDRLVGLIDDMIQHGTPLAECDFSKFMVKLGQNPHLIVEKGNWDKYKTTVEWFDDRILRPVQQNRKPSRLIQLLKLAPTNLGTVVRETYDEHKGDLPSGHVLKGVEELTCQEYLVFFAEPLLREIVKELFVNVYTRVEPKDSPITIWFKVEVEDEKIKMTVRNNFTNPLRKGSERGLDHSRDLLRIWGGELTRNSRPDDGESTFKVDLVFVRG